MGRIIRSTWGLAAVITALYCVSVLPLNESIAFQGPADDRSRALAWALRGSFAVTLFLAVRLILVLVRALRRGDRSARFGVAVAVVHTVVVVSVWLLIYPGQWAYDEFSVLQAAQDYQPYVWQHYFTVVFHTFCLYLIPTGPGIVLLQLLVAGAVVGSLAAGIHRTSSRPRMAAWILVPFLTLPAIYEANRPLRLTMYSYVLVFTVGKVVLLFRAHVEQVHRYREVVGYGLLIAVLACWRTEGVVYLLLIPVVLVRLGVLADLRARRFRALGALAAMLGLVGAALVFTQATSRPEYQLTALYNPLSVMVAQNLDGANSAENLRLVDEVFDVEHMRQYSDYSDIPGWWNGTALRPDWESHLDDFYQGAFGLVLHNPGAFLEARWQTFIATNSLDADRPYVPTGLVFSAPDSNEMLLRFDEQNLASQPWDQDVRADVARFLLQMQDDGRGDAVRPLVWTVLPTLAGLLVLALVGAATRRWLWSGLAVLLLGHAAVVFLTAPAYYFMYYVPVYVAGNALLVWSLIRLYDRLRGSRAVIVDPPGRVEERSVVAVP